ncbi:MAG: hypothetical protein HY235_01350 [Acidobacteria bacterium]|nr:hypothetical protein [Acidobacteriota bacterium]
MLVGEIKKGKYVYYHCTGNRGKCPEPYTPQQILASQFTDILQELVIPQAILYWLSAEVLDSDRTERASREQAVKRLQARYDQVEARIETMYVDKIEGRITQAFFDKQAEGWRNEQQAVLRKIEEIQKAAPAPVDQAIDTMRLMSQACHLFPQQSAEEQRRLLQTLIEDAHWQDGTLRMTLFEPFQILRHSNQESRRKAAQRADRAMQHVILPPRPVRSR